MLIIHTDGGSRGNPGPAGVGVWLQAGEQSWQHARAIGDTTNNVAEYTAVIDALKITAQLQAAGQLPSGLDLAFNLDSELVVKQLMGQYKVKDPGMQERYQVVITLLHLAKQEGQILSYSFTHIPRARNAVADQLYNAVLDGTPNLNLIKSV